MRPSYPSPLHGIYSNSPHSSINGDAKPPNGASSRKSFTNGGFGQNPSSSVKSLNKYYDSDSNSSNKYWIFILDLLILVHFILLITLFDRVTGKPPLKPKDTVDSGIKESPWIENAAYFLKEHEIFISHIKDCHNVYIRLIGENFSAKYERLRKEINNFYCMNPISLKNFVENTYCIGNNNNKHFKLRV